jgi:hypothetical protein
LRVNSGLQTHLKNQVACDLSGKRAEFYLVIEGLSSRLLLFFLEDVGIAKEAYASLLTIVCFHTTILACSETFTMESRSLLPDSKG